MLYKSWLVAVIFCLALFFSGCAKLKHLDKLLTLKGLADQQVALDEHVADVDEKFSRLSAAVVGGQLSALTSKSEIIKEYGEPIVDYHVDEHQERWLYRKSVEFWNPEKVYLYFDGDDRLVAWQHLQAEKNEKVKK